MPAYDRKYGVILLISWCNFVENVVVDVVELKNGGSMLLNFTFWEGGFGKLKNSKKTKCSKSNA